MDAGEDDSVMIRGAAYHEAGHAVAQVLFGMDLAEVVITSGEGEIGGVCSYHPPHQITLEALGVFYEGTAARHRYVSHLIMSTQAGEVSQRVFCPASVKPYHAAPDCACVERLIKGLDRCLSVQEQAASIDELRGFTSELLAEPRCTAAIHTVAKVLVQEKRIQGDRARKMILDAMNATRQADSSLPAEVPCPHCVAYEDRYDESEG